MSKQLKVGMLGLGVVGTGVPSLLKEHQEKIAQISDATVELSTVFVRQIEQKSVIAEKYDFNLTTSVDDVIVNPSIDIVVELIGGIEPAKAYIMTALKNGKHVVTANKDLMAQHGAELCKLAEKNNCYLYFEASVAGGIPILRTISNSFMGDRIERLYGVVNGTTNYMLTKMKQEQLNYDSALRVAQDLGFAESDPTNDVEGMDAAYKMVILSKFAFGMTLSLEDVSRKGITTITAADIDMAHSLGYTIKLIGLTEQINGGVNCEVRPTFVKNTHPLASVDNEMNAIFVQSNGMGESMYYGPGAGQKPTALSVVTDILTIADRLTSNQEIKAFSHYVVKTTLADPERVESCYVCLVEGRELEYTLEIISREMMKLSIPLDKLLITEEDSSANKRVIIKTDKMNQEQLLGFLDGVNKVEDIQIKSYYNVL